MSLPLPPVLQVHVEQRSLPWSLSECFADFEYLLRVDWLPEGRAVWFLLLDREQRHLQLAVLSLEAFTGSPDLPRPLLYRLWEETSEHWIEVGGTTPWEGVWVAAGDRIYSIPLQVADILEFSPPPSPSSPLRFLMSSEGTGYRHLYLVEAVPPQPGTNDGEPLPQATWTSKQLTAGEWVVFGSHVRASSCLSASLPGWLSASGPVLCCGCLPPQVWVDWSREVVYFEGNAATPLEKHL